MRNRPLVHCENPSAAKAANRLAFAAGASIATRATSSYARLAFFLSALPHHCTLMHLLASTFATWQSSTRDGRKFRIRMNKNYLCTWATAYDKHAYSCKTVSVAVLLVVAAFRRACFGLLPLFRRNKFEADFQSARSVICEDTEAVLASRCSRKSEALQRPTRVMKLRDEKLRWRNCFSPLCLNLLHLWPPTLLQCCNMH